MFSLRFSWNVHFKYDWSNQFPLTEIGLYIGNPVSVMISMSQKSQELGKSLYLATMSLSFIHSFSTKEQEGSLLKCYCSLFKIKWRNKFWLLPYFWSSRRKLLTLSLLKGCLSPYKFLPERPFVLLQLAE